jgi:high-affinity iron transporter
MGASFLITLREGMEAALILSIILAYLNSMGRADRHRVVWAGAGSAIAVSLIAGGVIFTVSGQLDHTAGEIFEGVASLLAVAVLTWMIFWMRRNAVHIKGELQERVGDALASGSSLGLAALAFFVVVREGLETVLFMFSAFRAGQATPAGLRFTGAALGLVTAVVLGYLIYRGGVKLNLRLFFRVTGVAILVVAASLLVYGVHELAEVGALRFLDGTGLLAPAPAVAGVVGAVLRVVVGLGGHLSWLEFGLWTGYVALTAALFFRPVRIAPPPAPAAEPAPAREAATS